MTTTGTTAFSPSLNEIVEESFERAGTELRSGYDFRTARRSLNILLADWANRGINMWSLDSGTIALTTSTATYNLPADTVDLLEHVVRTNPGVAATQSDLSISRISVSTYATIPNKLSTGRPIQVLVTRGAIQPTITVWPTPSDNTYTFVYWRLRRLYDAGDGVNTADIPFRFIPSLVAGLAYYVAMKLPGPEAQQRLQMLKMEYVEAWELSAGEDREKATLRLVPRIGAV